MRNWNPKQARIVFSLALLGTWLALMAPAKAQASEMDETEVACKTTYRVQKGDTLSEIVQDFRELSANPHASIYGKRGLLNQIVALNQKKIKNPALIRVGTVLKLPQGLLSIEVASACNLNKNKTSHHSSIPSQTASTPFTPAAKPAWSLTHTRAPASNLTLAAIAPTPASASVAPLAPLPPVQTVTHDSHSDEPSAAELPELARITLSGSASSGSGTFTPAYGIDAGFRLGRKWGITVGADGLSMLYPDPVFGNFSTTQAQVKLGAEYHYSEALKFGAGYRYFTFGYTNPAGSAASTHGLYLSAEGAKHLSRAWEFIGEADLRSAFSLRSFGSDTLGSSFQFAGFSLLLATHYSLRPGFFVGPYAFYDNNTLNWTQASTTTGTNSFTDGQYGAGLQFGWGF